MHSKRVAWLAASAILAAALVGGTSVAQAGPAPRLSLATAKSTASKWVRDLVVRLDDRSARGSVGHCVRLSRSRIVCTGSVSYSDTGQVCRVPVTVFTTNTDAEGHYSVRARGGRAVCTTSSAPAVPAGGGTYHRVGSGHWIQEVSGRGQFVTLEDRSVWEVSSPDQIDSSLWLILDDIVVLEGGSSRYPYRLVNTDQDETVEVRFLR